jgi:hypothetical protein
MSIFNEAPKKDEFAKPVAASVAPAPAMPAVKP